MELRVALFEDNLLLRESLYQLINGTEDFICVGAFPNCKDVLHDIRKSQPHVTLMDIQMPGITGIEGVRLIKENYPEIKVIMQTVVEDEQKIFASICNGASGYLLKNTAPARLLEAIKEVYAGGAPMTPSIAQKVLEKFRQENKSFHDDSHSLTEREKEILECLVKGMSYKMIATSCFISVDTVRHHIKHIYDKLHVNSKSAAVAKAIRGNIV